MGDAANQLKRKYLVELLYFEKKSPKWLVQYLCNLLLNHPEYKHISFKNRFSLIHHETTERFSYNNICKSFKPAVINCSSHRPTLCVTWILMNALISRITHNLLLQPSKLPLQPHLNTVIITSSRFGVAKS